MSGWTAVVSLRLDPGRKSRLAPALSAPARSRLVDRMAAHVVGRLAACRAVKRRLLLATSPTPELDAEWTADGGGGLNAELQRVWDASAGPLLVLHADLPWLDVGDVEALLDGAQASGAALAPDRAGAGTNALALAAPQPFAFAFGPASFARHRARLPTAAVVRRPGLALDLDTPEDLALYAADASRRLDGALPVADACMS